MKGIATKIVARGPSIFSERELPGIRFGQYAVVEVESYLDKAKFLFYEYTMSRRNEEVPEYICARFYPIGYTKEQALETYLKQSQKEDEELLKELLK